MKYSAIILAFAVGAFALPQDASVTSAPSTTSTALTPQQTCLNACASGDVTCQAECLGVARPNESQVDETTQCAAKCDQGSGSPEDTVKYAKCQQDCFAKYFPSSQTLSGAGPAGNAQATNSNGQPTGTGAQPEATGSESQTGTGAAPGSTGAASMNTVHIAGAGLAGLVLAVFGL